MKPDRIISLAVEQIPSHAVFLFDGNGKVMTWNEGVRQIFGYGREEFVGSNADAIFIPDDRQRGAPERERELALRDATVGDFRWHLRKDGTHFWANGSLHAVRSEEGELLGFLKIARDATRDKRLQEALEEAQQELQQRVKERTRELATLGARLRRSEIGFAEVFRVAPIAIALTTDDDVILDVNEAFERTTGYLRDEVLGRNAASLGLWGSREDQQKLRSEHAGSRGFRMLELHIRTKDGQARDILASAAAVEIDHRSSLVKMFLDITERKRTERHLLAALQEVMQDTSWLANRVMEKLAQARGDGAGGTELSDLTEREREVLQLIAQGKSNEQIGEELFLAPSTVRNYVTNIYGKIGVRSRAEAVVWARDRGLGGI